jgi:hypothetical protein
MKLPRTLLFPVLVISSVFCVSQATTAPDVIFDEYGDLRWEDAKARLDNFTIPLLNDTDTVGYILVSNETNGCSDEAAARGLRAKRYVVERRGVPWNHVVWRQEGYAPEIRTKLLVLPRGFTPSYPSLDSTTAKRSGPPSRACAVRLKKIKNSRW